MNRTLPPDDYDDNPEWTEADFARARPAADVLPAEVLAAFVKPAVPGNALSPTDTVRDQ